MDTNINIRTNSEIKEQATFLLNELGLSMATAINIFFKTLIKRRRIQFDIKLNDIPNPKTLEAMAESDKIAYNENVKGYDSIE